MRGFDPLTLRDTLIEKQYDSVTMALDEVEGSPTKERKEITVGYEYKQPLGWEVRFMVDGMTKLVIPLKALRIVVEAGDKKDAERQIELKQKWLSNAISFHGKK